MRGLLLPVITKISLLITENIYIYVYINPPQYHCTKSILFSLMDLSLIILALLFSIFPLRSHSQFFSRKFQQVEMYFKNSFTLISALLLIYACARKLCDLDPTQLVTFFLPCVVTIFIRWTKLYFNLRYESHQYLIFDVLINAMMKKKLNYILITASKRT